MQIKLRVMDGSNAGRELPIKVAKFLVGRAEDCHLKPNSEKISRYHCCINNEDGMITVRDMGSKNGTFVNGERVSGERELRTGDMLGFGPLQFEIVITVDIKGEKKPAVHSVKEAAARTAQGPASALDIDSWINGSVSINPNDDTSVVDLDELQRALNKQKKSIPPINPPLSPAPPANNPAAPAAGNPAASGLGLNKPPAKPADKTSGDTRSAAADALRKFMGGR